MGQDKQPDSPWVLPVLKFSPARALPVPRVAADGFCHMSQCWGRVPAPQQGWVGCVAAPGLHPGCAEPLARRAWLCAVPACPQPLVPLQSPCQVAQDTQGQHKDPAAAEPWDPLECSGSLLPFLRAPEGKAAPEPAAGREGGDEPWAPGPSAGAEPRGGVGPFSLLQLPNHWKQEENQAEKWEFPLLFCPDTVGECRVTPGEICLRSGSRCCISLISNHLLIALRSDLQVILIKYLV